MTALRLISTFLPTPKFARFTPPVQSGQTEAIHPSGKTYRHLLPLLLIPLILPSSSVYAQSRPCRDTVVRIFDSICEGETYDFNGRTLQYSGLYFDTIPRVDTNCDSIIILKLSLLPIPETGIYNRKQCRGNVGHDLVGGVPQVTYYLWTASPADSTLNGQEHFSWVHVNPSQPTTYTLYLDYRPNPPQCPYTTSIKIYPIETVKASLYATPDEITYDDMHIIVEDFSYFPLDPRTGGWAGRNWYINDELQVPNDRRVEFYGNPSWGDTVKIMMETYTSDCLDTAIKNIPFRRVALFFPNTFTPDNSTNNIFKPSTTGVFDYQLWIYNKFGTLLFHTNDPEQGWDGSSNGRPCPQSTYTYVCRYKDAITPAGYQTAKGTITLLR